MTMHRHIFGLLHLWAVYLYPLHGDQLESSQPRSRKVCVLPGLCGAAEGSIGSSPDKDFQSSVQQEDVAAKNRKTGCYGHNAPK